MTRKKPLNISEKGGDRRGGGGPALNLRFLKYPDDYRKTVIRGANTNGDSDSIALDRRRMSGPYLGVDAIPDDWVNRMEKNTIT